VSKELDVMEKSGYMAIISNAVIRKIANTNSFP
jgi:hypothetical protein